MRLRELTHSYLFCDELCSCVAISLCRNKDILGENDPSPLSRSRIILTPDAFPASTSAHRPLLLTLLFCAGGFGCSHEYDGDHPRTESGDAGSKRSGDRSRTLIHQ